MSTVFTTLPGHPHSVGAARHFVTACLRACPVGVPNEITEAVELVVSELATNALRHTRTRASGGTFSVRVETTPCRVRGKVHSGALLHRHDTPHVFQADLGGLAEGGRGLALVDQLTTRWGSLPHAHGVYFLLRWPTPRT
ncbi:ATP-binding protein [Thermobifida cellulosilytica]|uniref:Histidine kinase/HSP90-like ATPase domain-containing protein n=1 Tax=Thermobifida cellulosilytica TB100 TaxID=665004 RepID=A0A147KK10_THECS|nr:ATP-binding protein [Thermobifida cellulosilytica]KUP97636.1 hypothetical protein AC529_06195 [Thermobifida cellulosilytica TB100]